MRHEKTVSVSKIKPLWEPWEEDETPRKFFPGMCKRLKLDSLPVDLYFIFEILQGILESRTNRAQPTQSLQKNYQNGTF